MMRLKTAIDEIITLLVKIYQNDYYIHVYISLSVTCSKVIREKINYFEEWLHFHIITLQDRDMFW